EHHARLPPRSRHAHPGGLGVRRQDHADRPRAGRRGGLPGDTEMNLKNSCWPREYTEGTTMKPCRDVPARRLMAEGRCSAKRMLSSVSFRVFPWQMRFWG